MPDVKMVYEVVHDESTPCSPEIGTTTGGGLPTTTQTYYRDPYQRKASKYVERTKAKWIGGWSKARRAPFYAAPYAYRSIEFVHNRVGPSLREKRSNGQWGDTNWTGYGGYDALHIYQTMGGTMTWQGPMSYTNAVDALWRQSKINALANIDPGSNAGFGETWLETTSALVSEGVNPLKAIRELAKQYSDGMDSAMAEYRLSLAPRRVEKYRTAIKREKVLKDVYRRDKVTRQLVTVQKEVEVVRKIRIKVSLLLPPAVGEKKRALKRLTKLQASLYLAFQFGVMNSVGAIKDILEAISTLPTNDGKAPTLRARGTVLLGYSLVGAKVSNNNNVPGQWLETAELISGSRSMRGTTGIYYRVNRPADNVASALARNLGLDFRQALKTAWATAKYSWIIDQFYAVGKSLQAFQNLHSWEIVILGGYTTVVWSQEVVAKYTDSVNASSSRTPIRAGEAVTTVKERQMLRTVLTDYEVKESNLLPVPKIPQLGAFVTDAAYALTKLLR